MKLLMKNRLLFLFLILTIISFLSGLFFYVFIDDNSKKIVSDNIDLLINNKLINNSLIVNNSIISISVFLFGISIVGTIIIIPIFLFKVFIFSFEGICLLSNLGFKNIFILLLYLLPNFIQIISYFLICYYGCCYSLYLIKHLFKNINYNMTYITKRYLIVFIISFVFLILSCFLEILIISNLKLFLIK